MDNPNVMQAVGEAFAAHHITVRPDERMSDAVARTLGLSQPDANRWMEALDSGCTVEEANRRVGIVSHKENAPFLNTMARLIGSALGSVTPR
jgi:hypothetical protein